VRINSRSGNLNNLSISGPNVKMKNTESGNKFPARGLTALFESAVYPPTPTINSRYRRYQKFRLSKWKENELSSRPVFKPNLWPLLSLEMRGDGYWMALSTGTTSNLIGGVYVFLPVCMACLAKGRGRREF